MSFRSHGFTRVCKHMFVVPLADGWKGCSSARTAGRQSEFCCGTLSEEGPNMETTEESLPQESLLVEDTQTEGSAHVANKWMV